MQVAVGTAHAARSKHDGELERRLRRMTILVGMIGSDGIVLAVDQRMVREAKDGREYDDKSLIRKIEHLATHHIAYAGVGDQFTWQVGRALSIRLDKNDFDFEKTGVSLEKLAVDTMKEEEDQIKECYPSGDHDIPRALVLVFYGKQWPFPQVWGLTIHQRRSFAHLITGMVIAGAQGNLARFFGEYYRANTSVAALKTLAAYIVLAAGRFDSLMISGLDVALFGEDGFRLLSESEKEILRSGYEELDGEIRNRLLPLAP
jgi:hypothetical protein